MAKLLHYAHYPSAYEIAFMFSTFRIASIVSPVYKLRDSSIIIFYHIFSYGQIYRQAILDLLLTITEYFINLEFKKNLQNFDKKLSYTKTYLNGKHLRQMVSSLCIFIQELINNEDQVEFIQTYMIDGLVDLRSNYLIRKYTLLNFSPMVLGKR